MKKCPKCGKIYDDSWEICLNDETPLEIAPDIKNAPMIPTVRKECNFKVVSITAATSVVLLYYVLYRIAHTDSYRYRNMDSLPLAFISLAFHWPVLIISFVTCMYLCVQASKAKKFHYVSLSVVLIALIMFTVLHGI